MRFSCIKSFKIYEFLIECQDLGFSWDFVDGLADCEDSKQVIEKIENKYGDQYFEELKNIIGNIDYYYKDIHVYKALFFSEIVVRTVIVFDIDLKDINKIKLKNPKSYETMVKYGLFNNRVEYEDIYAD